MFAIALHDHGGRIDDLKKGLKYENIDLECIQMSAEDSTPVSIYDACVILIRCSSPDTDLINTVLSDISSKSIALPVIVIDENEHAPTRALAISLGADDYFSKPVDFQKLGFRMKQLGCRKVTSPCQSIKAFDVRLDLKNRFVTRKKQIFHLRNKEFALLEFFMINKGKILTRNSILEYVWDRNANFSSNTVDVHISRLRRKLDNPFKNKLIHTIHCIGYVFDSQDNIREL